MAGWEQHALPPFLLSLLSFLPFLLPSLSLSSSIGSYCFLKYLLFIFDNYMHVYSVILMAPPHIQLEQTASKALLEAV